MMSPATPRMSNFAKVKVFHGVLHKAKHATHSNDLCSPWNVYIVSESMSPAHDFASAIRAFQPDCSKEAQLQAGRQEAPGSLGVEMGWGSDSSQTLRNSEHHSCCSTATSGICFQSVVLIRTPPDSPLAPPQTPQTPPAFCAKLFQVIGRTSASRWSTPTESWPSTTPPSIAPR